MINKYLHIAGEERKQNAVKRKLLFGQTFVISLLSCLIPMVLALLVYAILGFYPFGEKSVLIMDMADQYVAFFSSLREIVSGESSIFFSWAKSFGSSYIGVFAYYISSPLSFLTLLFPETQLPLGLLFLTVVKIGLSGLTMSLYLRYGFEKRNWSIVLFSICYAMMSYNFVYSLSLMWLDGVIWLPIILLGIERILKNKGPMLFLASLAVLFVSNYYISYMVGIFCVIYFLFRYFSGDYPIGLRDILKKIGICAVSVITAFGFSAWLTVPTVVDLMQGKIGGSNYTPDSFWNFYPYQFFLKLLPGQYDSITNSGLPAVFCGSVILIFAVLYFVHTRIKLREKLVAAGILVFLLLSFSVLKLDLFWHVFQYPNWFPYRYAFLFSFFIILLAYRAVLKHDFVQAFSKKRLGAASLAAVTLISCGELLVNGTVMIDGLDQQFGYKKVESYNSFYEELRPLVAYAEEQGEDFYRIEKDFEYSKNDALALGYHGITHYSSAYNRHINETTAMLGMGQTYFWNSYYGSTPVPDSLFGVRYVMSKGKLPAFYQAVKQNGTVTLYENPYYLPIGIGADDGVAAYQSEGYDYFAAQNRLLSGIYGADVSVFEEASFQKQGDANRLEYRFTASATGPYCISLASHQSAGADIWVNGEKISGYFTGETKHCLYIGTFEAGQSVEVICDIYRGSISLLSEDIYRLNVERYTAVMTELRERSLRVNDYRSGFINGTVDMEEKGNLFFSIPYDEGFTILVDGEKTAYTAVADTFILLPLSAGHHEIELRYLPKGYTVGALLTAVAAVLLFAFLAWKRFFKKPRNNG